MSMHPECKHDEVFVTNADDSTWKRIGWQTKRKGRFAYTKSGDTVGSKWPGSYPVFVKREEIAARDPEILKRLEEL